MRFEFDWDPIKAASNQAKHSVSFEDAMAVFLDPLSLSRLYDEHDTPEERWVTLGRGKDARLLVVVHTYIELTDDHVAVRIISARRPTKRKTRQYEEGTA